jgi:hypothetical protein
MILESADSIKAYLSEHRDFGDCILDDVVWLQYGTIIQLVFDYIWEPDGSIRTEYSKPCIKRLTLQNVQEWRVLNGLGEYMVLHPEELDWGLSEVAIVRLVDNSAMVAR